MDHMPEPRPATALQGFTDQQGQSPAAIQACTVVLAGRSV